MNIGIQLYQNKRHTMHSILIEQWLHLFKLPGVIMLHCQIFGAIYQLILILNGIRRLSILCHKIHWSDYSKTQLINTAKHSIYVVIFAC